MNLRLLFTVVWAILNLGLAASITRAAEPGPIVKSIDVRIAGPKSVLKEKILPKLQIQVGKDYSNELAEADILLLSAEENVANVRIFTEPVKDGVKVIVALQTKAPARAKP
jgi:outer membrane protein assembly factor BamA